MNEKKNAWMRKYRRRKRNEKLLATGHCPICTMLLDPEFEVYHALFKCPYWVEHIHAKIANNEEMK